MVEKIDNVENKELEKRLNSSSIIENHPLFKPIPNPIGTTFIWVLLTKRSLRKAIHEEIRNARNVF